MCWIFILTSCVSAGTTTTNYSLYKPAVDETGWGALMNDNFDDIDTAMKANADDIDTNDTATGLNTTHRTSDGSDHSDVVANTAKVTNATHSGEVTGSGALTIADNIVDEANLKVNSPTNDYVLTADSGEAGGMKWAVAVGGTGGGASSLTELSDVSSATATSGNILIANGSTFDSLALSGDATIDKNGVISVSNTADYIVVLRPQQAKLPSSNPMVIDGGNGRWRGLFDDTTSESATWEDVLQPYSGTLKAKLYYTAVSATSGTAAFDIEIECKTDADAVDFDTDSYGTADTLSGTVAGTAGYLDVLSDTSLNGDSCAEGDHITVKVSRNVTTDNVSGDLELRKVVIYAE